MTAMTAETKYKDRIFFVNNKVHIYEKSNKQGKFEIFDTENVGANIIRVLSNLKYWCSYARFSFIDYCIEYGVDKNNICNFKHHQLAILMRDKAKNVFSSQEMNDFMKY